MIRTIRFASGFGPREAARMVALNRAALNNDDVRLTRVASATPAEVASRRADEAVSPVCLVADLAELSDAQALVAPRHVRRHIARRAVGGWLRLSRARRSDAETDGGDRDQ
jgi:hypothetical protein